MGPVSRRGLDRRTKSDLSLEVSRTGTLPETPAASSLHHWGRLPAVMMVTPTKLRVLANPDPTRPRYQDLPPRAVIRVT
jgi:hypothetical protein